MSIMNRVREAIAKSHDEIEQTRFSDAMVQGTVSRSDYARLLVQLLSIHEAIECSYRTVPTIEPFFSEEMLRTATIRRDLESLRFAPNSFSLLPQTNTIVLQLGLWVHTNPYALLGCLYVLEGSRMGSLVLAKPLAKAFGLLPGETQGIEYHTEGAAKTPMRVRKLKEQIDQADFSPSAQASIIEGAKTFMEMLGELYANLPLRHSPSNIENNMCPFLKAQPAIEPSDTNAA